ncbi:GrpB family protein [Blastococcus sp. TF02-8]|uniref:GrpB family protein n=1 Tax=Blastococcus sp. TF02-8 TaxID=2250574 RepID=UPI000DE9C86F|nr:GrpB family protein [Blastococcus sp. TF02-8]RBY93402.1 GrpB family protein [Blastococcus sp. TF02-8]
MELVDADVTGWAARFALEAAVVGRVLPRAAVEHIGSTALGIRAKDVVDVLVGTPQAEHDEAVARLVAIGMVVDGERTTGEGERHTWLARWEGGRRVTVVHVVDAEGGEWVRRTTFRDVLRRDEALQAEYVRLKSQLAATTDDWTEYTARKAAFVRRALQRRG